MIVVGLTKKLQNKLNIKISKTPDIMPNKLYSWHGNLFKYGRRNGVIFMNDLTRYTVLLYGLKSPDYKNIHKLFIKQLERNMKHDNFSDETTESFLRNINDILYIKTASRSVLGSINDCLLVLEHSEVDYSQLSDHELDELNNALNSMPMMPLKKQGFIPFPKDALAETLNPK